MVKLLNFCILEESPIWHYFYFISNIICLLKKCYFYFIWNL